MARRGSARRGTRGTPWLTPHRTWARSGATDASDVVPFGVSPPGGQPRRRFLGTRFWKKFGPAPVLVALHQQGAPADRLHQRLLDRDVIAGEVELRLAALKEEPLLGAGDGDRRAPATSSSTASLLGIAAREPGGFLSPEFGAGRVVGLWPEPAPHPASPRLAPSRASTATSPRLMRWRITNDGGTLACFQHDRVLARGREDPAHGFGRVLVRHRMSAGRADELVEVAEVLDDLVVGERRLVPRSSYCLSNQRRMRSACLPRASCERSSGIL